MTATLPAPVPGTREPVVRLRDVTVHRGDRRILDGLDLEVPRGTVLAVLGPSGAGKSTLLKLLTREVAATRGSVELAGGTSAREGVVHQDPHLFGWLTIAENVAVGQRFAANRRDPGRVTELLAMLGLDQVADRWPDEVSGGQAQRAALARALAIGPDLLLLDEPFSALDPASRGQLQAWLRGAVERDGLTAVVVTHDIEEALVLADHVVLLGSGGHVVRSWDLVPAADRAAAVVHPVASEIRAGYARLGAAAPEPDDEEWSGYADTAPGVTRGAPPPSPGRSGER
ncbi:hypothetical protein GCM10027418_28280 [Mariniluteicoccus endophyticus]